MLRGGRVGLLAGFAVLASLSALTYWPPHLHGFDRVPGGPCGAAQSGSRLGGCELRGTCLLHAWTDDQLFRLAIAAERKVHGGKRYPQQIAHRRTSDHEAAEVSHRRKFDHETDEVSSKRSGLEFSDERCSDQGSWVGEERARECGLKVAFLFLTRGALPLGAVWNEFFRGHEGRYNVYVHMDPLSLTALSARDSGVFWGRAVPSEQSQRGSPGLIAATRRLMANALLDDPANEWFATVSDSCVPVRGFPHVYRTLASTGKSFIEWASEDIKMWDRWRARGEEVMLPEVPFSDYRISAQFFVLRRRHTILIVNDTLYWSKFRRPCLPNFKWKCFPEEHYFATLLAKHVDQNETTVGPPTLTDWSVSDACPRPPEPGHPREFCAGEISEDFIRGLQARDGGRYLFVRKFQPDTLVGLMKLSGLLLNSSFVQ